jgi:hypothetical protein
MIVIKCLNCRGKNNYGDSKFHNPFTEGYVVRHENMERPYNLVAGSLEKSVLCKFLSTTKDKQRDMCKAGYLDNPKKWGYCPYVKAS